MALAGFTTERYHTNFGLSAEGEAVVLTQTTGSASTTLVAAGSTWAYLDDGSDQSTQWRARKFDDSGWASGPADFGYGDDPVTEFRMEEMKITNISQHISGINLT